MKTIYKFPVRNSSETILIEIESDGGQMVKASRARQEAQTASITINEVFAKLQPITSVIVDILDVLTIGDKVPEITFGVKLTPDGDVLISSNQSEVNFIITMRDR